MLKQVAQQSHKKSHFYKKNFKKFKRRKVFPQGANLTVEERLDNIHEDVLIVQDCAKEILEKMDKLSLSQQDNKNIKDESSQNKILENETNGNLKSLSEFGQDNIEEIKLTLVQN